MLSVGLFNYLPLPLVATRQSHAKGGGINALLI